jgi:hypothetical protein
MDLVVFLISFFNIYTNTQIGYSLFNHCVKVTLYSDDLNNTGCKSIKEVNMYNPIEMGEARSKGLIQNFLIIKI